MKISIAKKINKKGASIAVALVLFMLCALAGASALSMASANAGRLSHRNNDEQPYYSVSSAALLFVDLFHNLRYNSGEVTYTYVREWKYNSADSSRPQTEEYTLNCFDALNGKCVPVTGTADIASRDNESEGDRSFRHKVEALKLVKQIGIYCDGLVPYLNVPQEWYESVSKKSENMETFRPEKSFDFPFDITVAGNESQSVKGRIIMNSNYDLLISLTCSKNGDSPYSLNIYWEATVTEKTSSEPNKFEISDGGMGKMTTKQTKTVTVNWLKENVTISRGEAVTSENI